MAVQDEVAWALATIKSNWPGDWPADDDGTDRLYRVNRDDPLILETGRETLEVDRTRASALGASLGSRDPEVAGPDNRRRVTTTVDCRLKGLDDSQHGHITSANHAKRLAIYAHRAIQQELSYPDVDPDAEDIGRVAYHTATVSEPTSRSQEWMDEYFWTWAIELVGYESI
ncbi:hypothetical protein [Halosimplex pelagicum]|uniref:Uncharacterized protein n=1 Tax=Halosimplex pelagicum TaxID=869886 RepID=A0A7D5PDI2_9EURY|nr:hypothetical protein [Halosimplex pelagicum]QLH80980.1 hypothetical protein HZS54_04720 [Halosimplex pelagicum]